MAIVIGADGYSGGWIFVRLENGRFAGATAHSSFAEGVSAHSDAVVVGVDMPIGYPLGDRRLADVAARKLLRGKASSVFWVHPREVISAPDWASANALSRVRSGMGISKQSYALRTKILEVEQVASDDRRVYEVHPEVSFAEMGGGVVVASKKTWAGLVRRRRLLVEAGIVVPDDLAESVGRAAADDVLDAAAAAWSAVRIANGEAKTLPEEPEIGPDRRPIAIWY